MQEEYDYVKEDIMDELYILDKKLHRGSEAFHLLNPTADKFLYKIAIRKMKLRKTLTDEINIT